MGYKQNNPLPMMKSAMKMMKAERKSGMHRDSAMYMNSPMYSGHSPMEMGYDSPAKKYDSPMHKEESRELKDMPIVDIEKGDAKADRKDARKEQPKSKREYGSPAKMKKDSPMEKELVGKQKNLPEHLKKAIEAAPESPTKHITKFLDKDHPHNKNHDARPMHSHTTFKSKSKSIEPKKKDEKSGKGKGSPAKKYDRVVLGGNKGDKSKTKPGKKDYEKGSPAKKEGMSKKETKDLGRMIRTAQGKATKKDERKNKRDTKKTMRHVKKHGSGLKMD